MRVMIKFALPVESGNDAIRTGKLAKVMHQVAEDLKPRGGLFFPDSGRTGRLLHRGHAGFVADSGYGRALLLWPECEGGIRAGHERGVLLTPTNGCLAWSVKRAVA